MYFIIDDLKKIKHTTVELIVSLFFALSCLLLFWLLPKEIEGRLDMTESILRAFIFLVVFPILYIRIVLKKSFADIYISSHKNILQTILPTIFALAVGVLSIVCITQSFLRDHYYSLVNYLSIKFQVFLIYEVFIAFFYLFFVIFSFGFVNSITKKYDKLNKLLPIFTFFLLLMTFFDSSGELLLINLLMILPTLFFRKIVNISQSIWSLYFLLLLLNIILNTVIIKIAL